MNDPQRQAFILPKWPYSPDYVGPNCIYLPFILFFCENVVFLQSIIVIIPRLLSFEWGSCRCSLIHFGKHPDVQLRIIKYNLIPKLV